MPCDSPIVCHYFFWNAKRAGVWDTGYVLIKTVKSHLQYNLGFKISQNNHFCFRLFNQLLGVNYV